MSLGLEKKFCLGRGIVGLVSKTDQSFGPEFLVLVLSGGFKKTVLILVLVLRKKYLSGSGKRTNESLGLEKDSWCVGLVLGLKDKIMNVSVLVLVLLVLRTSLGVDVGLENKKNSRSWS